MPIPWCLGGEGEICAARVEQKWKQKRKSEMPRSPLKCLKYWRSRHDSNMRPTAGPTTHIQRTQLARRRRSLYVLGHGDAPLSLLPNDCLMPEQIVITEKNS